MLSDSKKTDVPSKTPSDSGEEDRNLESIDVPTCSSKEDFDLQLRLDYLCRICGKTALPCGYPFCYDCRTKVNEFFNHEKNALLLNAKDFDNLRKKLKLFDK